MANQKRASMREGPLAALFRRTDELEGAAAHGEDHPRPSAAPSGEAGPTASSEHAAPAPATAAGAARRDVDPLVTHGPQEPPAHPRATGYPHPSLADDDRQARLDGALAADLPEDMMAPPAPAPAPAVEPPLAAEPSAWGSGPSVFDEPSPWSTEPKVGTPTIRVVGVGGGGVNAVNRMVEAEVTGVEFLAVNTDLQSLQQSTADITLHIGPKLTRGLGAGSDPELGRQAAMEEYDRLKSLLKGSDMVFIATGEGGGTGTGAAPIVARIAREIGALTVGIVTKPFGFEGARRQATAQLGIDVLGDEVDTLITVPNNRLLSVLDKRTSMVDAFRVADDVLRQGVQGISDLVVLPGIINLDFADVRTIMSEAGAALLGIGMGTGEQRALEAAEKAVSSPLLETSMNGARSILLSITGGSDLSLWEVNEAAKAVAEAAHPDANIIFGAMVDEKMDENQVWITVVATRYDQQPTRQRRIDEPTGEPRVRRREPEPRITRRSEPPRYAAGGRGRGGMDVDVPEFVPRGR